MFRCTRNAKAQEAPTEEEDFSICRLGSKGERQNGQLKRNKTY